MLLENILIDNYKYSLILSLFLLTTKRNKPLLYEFYFSFFPIINLFLVTSLLYEQYLFSNRVYSKYKELMELKKNEKIN